MKLGIGLPTTLVPALNRGLFVDWCRAADQAGFHALGTIDQPSYDSWEPLAALAAAASVTERARLATTILQLPNRNEVLVAKQAAVVDRLSGGRLDLGIAVGAREQDYKTLGVRMAGRGKKIERQVRKIRRIWRAAKRANETEGQPGPAPLQKPLPPIWMGGFSEPAIKRAVAMGDGFIFGTAGAEVMAAQTPRIRALAEEAGRKVFPVAGLAYFAVGDDATAVLETGTKALNRYYRGKLWKDPGDLIHHGPGDAIAQAAKEYEQAGLDVLILCPTVPDVRQVEQVAEHVLPAYRVPAR